jgi:hypothetical protein
MIDSRLEGCGFTPLHVACLKASVGLVSFLLGAGADPECASATGWTAMHFAACGGDEDTFACVRAWRAKHGTSGAATEAWPPGVRDVAIAYGQEHLLDREARGSGSGAAGGAAGGGAMGKGFDPGNPGDPHGPTLGEKIIVQREPETWKRGDKASWDTFVAILREGSLHDRKEVLLSLVEDGQDNVYDARNLLDYGCDQPLRDIIRRNSVAPIVIDKTLSLLTRLARYEKPEAEGSVITAKCIPDLLNLCEIGTKAAAIVESRLGDDRARDQFLAAGGPDKIARLRGGFASMSEEELVALARAAAAAAPRPGPVAARTNTGGSSSSSSRSSGGGGGGGGADDAGRSGGRGARAPPPVQPRPAVPTVSVASADDIDRAGRADLHSDIENSRSKSSISNSDSHSASGGGSPLPPPSPSQEQQQQQQQQQQKSPVAAKKVAPAPVVTKVHPPGTPPRVVSNGPNKLVDLIGSAIPEHTRVGIFILGRTNAGRRTLLEEAAGAGLPGRAYGRVTTAEGEFGTCSVPLPNGRQVALYTHAGLDPGSDASAEAWRASLQFIVDANSQSRNGDAPRIMSVWYCIDPSATPITAQERSWIAALAELVPVLAVVTKCNASRAATAECKVNLEASEPPVAYFEPVVRVHAKATKVGEETVGFAELARETTRAIVEGTAMLDEISEMRDSVTGGHALTEAQRRDRLASAAAFIPPALEMVPSLVGQSVPLAHTGPTLELSGLSALAGISYVLGAPFGKDGVIQVWREVLGSEDKPNKALFRRLSAGIAGEGGADVAAAGAVTDAATCVAILSALAVTYAEVLVEFALDGSLAQATPSHVSRTVLPELEAMCAKGRQAIESALRSALS